MKQGKAFELLMAEYGLIGAGRLLQHAAILQGIGPAAFDEVMSPQLRSKVAKQLLAVGVHWDDIEWNPGIERWYVSMARATMKRARRSA